ncbi:MAG: hypothetical protein JKY34_08675 [Kordiimonadaceae bacterium]|nr:hypothetical protein [Kordiimonadaceae bacterium]
MKQLDRAVRDVELSSGAFRLYALILMTKPQKEWFRLSLKDMQLALRLDKRTAIRHSGELVGRGWLAKRPSMYDARASEFIISEPKGDGNGTYKGDKVVTITGDRCQESHLVNHDPVEKVTGLAGARVEDNIIKYISISNISTSSSLTSLTDDEGFLPSNFPTNEMQAWATEELGDLINLAMTTRLCRAYYRNRQRKDWWAVWHRWCLQAAEKGQANERNSESDDRAGRRRLAQNRALAASGALQDYFRSS